MLFEQTMSGRGTHALVIGVGAYPHLPGGSGRTFHDPTLFHGLGQLTSPPVSATAVATWLIDLPRKQWKAPLASVELLTSPSTGGLYSEPTITNVRRAYREWQERAATHPDNVAVFYFCGHGLQSDTRRLLLTSDFANDDDQPLLGAFEFETTRDASVQRHPHTQCFFIDACASTASWLLRHQAVVPGLASPVEGSTGEEAGCHVTVLSSQAFATAGSAPNKVSFFTGALIKALAGGAARRDGFFDWTVHTQDIGAAVTALAQRDGKILKPPQQKSVGNEPLWSLAAPPPVELTVGCNPGDAHPHAVLACTRYGDPNGRQTRSTPQLGPWPVRSSAGSHLFEATFPDQRFNPAQEVADVVPPGSEYWLRVRP